MEEIHGVDVSWLHRPHKDAQLRNPTSSPLSTSKTIPSVTVTPTSITPNGMTLRPADASKKLPSPGRVTPATLADPARDATPALPTPPLSSPMSTTPPSGKTPPKRPGLLNRASSEKQSGDAKSSPRRSSWLRDISSKFTSQPTSSPSASQTQVIPQSSGSAISLASSTSSSPPKTSGANAYNEEAEAQNVPSKPKDSASFFSNFTRKLSSGSQPGGTSKVQGTGGMCERRILNQDPNRERCLYPELEATKLRKVAFCVDVEIAGGPRYKDDGDDLEKKRLKKDAKLKERAEGEALKHPDAIKEEKDTLGEVKLESESDSIPIPTTEPEPQPEEDQVDSASPETESTLDDGLPSSIDRKKEKKKRSEEERKERKEKRRRRAEENGSIPVEFQVEDVLAEVDADTIASSLSEVAPAPVVPAPPAPAATPPARKDKPTTDPVRIYRRCCQLRETPILKRITEQLMAPTCCIPLEPGVVHSLNLTGSRLQPSDMVTLGDWLAVVPVKKLLLENADITDEGLRCVLAGLLATKQPAPSKRKQSTPRHREDVPVKHYQERAGVIEKLNLKNNPRLTRVGWKYVSTFLYQCRSLKALDMSMNRFPNTLPPGHNKQAHQNAADLDAAETFHKCLSQRMGGSRLEELIISECGFTSKQIRKMVDGAIICSVQRLGLGGNKLDDEGFEHVLRYLESGVCGGLDIGGSDLRGKLHRIAKIIEARKADSCWGLSLADCNLDTASVKQLLPALQTMPTLRFLDLSHNPDLFSHDHGMVSLLRKYIGRMKALKRLHLADVGMSPKQAIALADVLPEGPVLAHLSILENAKLTALASATDEESQEEACALYASYMAAVRVSKTLMCIDIDVPGPEANEIVRALAKQVVAYSLRNMEQFAIAETNDEGHPTGDQPSPSSERKSRDIIVPNVLMHLVGHPDGSSDTASAADPAPGEDYIVGGTGLAKALQYVLGEKAGDRRSHSPGGPGSGNRTPRPDSGSGFREEQRIKAKEMSKDLLGSARRIRTRLQPALAKEYAAGDEMAYRRLVFLDQTLQNMVQRFEEEYPETRLDPSTPIIAPEALHSTRSPITEQFPQLAPGDDANGIEPPQKSDDEDDFDDAGTSKHLLRSRHNSDVSLTSRALAIEEGHLHRLGSKLRRDILASGPVPCADASSAITPDDDPTANTTTTSSHDTNTATTPSHPTSPPTTTPVPPLATTIPPSPSLDSPTGPTPEEEQRLSHLQARLDAISGEQWRAAVRAHGWHAALSNVGANYADLRSLQERDPNAWQEFIESQVKARINVKQTSAAVGGGE